MITVPLADIKSKIKEQKGISDEEISNKIKAKLNQLSGLISEEGAAHIIANELGVKLVPSGEKLTVKNVLAGMRNVEVTGKVTQKFEIREFTKGERTGKVANLMISDETGFIRIVFWNDQTEKFNEIKEGDILKIQGGYVRDNNGRKEIHLNDQASITINPEGVSVKALQESVQRKKLSELKEGDDNVEVLATIVQVFDIRFFEIDPETKRRVVEKEGKFFLGEKEVLNPTFSYVLNIFLDDGTENIRTVLWKNQIQKLLGLDDEGVLKFRDNPSDFEPIKTDLLGTIVKVVGRTNKNQTFDRLELVANMVYKDVNPEVEIENLKKETQTEKVEEVKEKKEISEETPPIVNEEPVSSQTETVSNPVKDDEVLSIEDLEDIEK